MAAAIYVAAKLGIADCLAERAKSANELAFELNFDQKSLYRLLCALASFNIFIEKEDTEPFFSYPYGRYYLF